MVRKTRGLNAIVAGVLFSIIGIALFVCTLPIFTHTRQELVEVPRSETVIDSAFIIDQSQDKTAQFMMSIGQSLDVFVESSGNMSFSIANFTNPDVPIRADQPDIVYFSKNDSLTINMTWSPQSRVPDAGKYYLVFLARNASIDSPVHVYANATKDWIDIRLNDVLAEDRIPLLDQNFVYLGSVLAVLGTAVFSITLSRNRKSRKRK